MNQSFSTVSFKNKFVPTRFEYFSSEFQFNPFFILEVDRFYSSLRSQNERRIDIRPAHKYIYTTTHKAA